MSYYLLAVDLYSDGLQILNNDHGLEVWIFNDIDELEEGIKQAIPIVEAMLEFGQSYSDIDHMLNVIQCKTTISDRSGSPISVEKYIKKIRLDKENQETEKENRRRLYYQLREEFG